MKLFLEEETTSLVKGENEKSFTRVREVSSKTEAISQKRAGKKSFLHKCFHDEQNARGGQAPSCKREAI